MYLSEPRVHSLSAMGEPYPALSAPAKRRGNGEDLRANGQPVNVRALPKANAKAYGLRPSERMWVWLGGLNAGPNCVASCIIKSPSWLTLGRASCTEHSASFGAMLSTREVNMLDFRAMFKAKWPTDTAIDLVTDAGISVSDKDDLIQSYNKPSVPPLAHKLLLGAYYQAEIPRLMCKGNLPAASVCELGLEAVERLAKAYDY